jgi:hypothetical protein
MAVEHICSVAVGIIVRTPRCQLTALACTGGNKGLTLILLHHDISVSLPFDRSRLAQVSVPGHFILAYNKASGRHADLQLYADRFRDASGILLSRRFGGAAADTSAIT